MSCLNGPRYCVPFAECYRFTFHARCGYFGLTMSDAQFLFIVCLLWLQLLKKKL